MEVQVKKRKKQIYKTKIKTTFSFHIKSNEKYTKIENNYSRRHGAMEGASGRFLIFLRLFSQDSVSAGLFGGGAV